MTQIQTDQNGRIIAMSQDTPLPLGVQIDLPEGFDMMAQGDYRIMDGALVRDPLPQPPPVPSELDKAKAEIAALKAENLMVMGALTDVYEMLLGGL